MAGFVALNHADQGSTPWAPIMRLLALISLLAACAPALSSPNRPPGRPVTSDLYYSTSTDVPRSLQHLIPLDHIGPVYFAVSDGMVCLVPAEVYTMLRYGDLLDCAWRFPRP